MRYIIYGAGAIGGTIGARLHQSGQDVVLICRGQHLDAIRDRGLTFRTPDETETLPIPAAGHPREISFDEGDVVLLTMKSQDTMAALLDLREAAGDVPVVCAQNGVANERMASRIFSRVYGMVVWLPASYLEPGEVLAFSAPKTGLLDTGRYPAGTDDVAEQVALGLSASRFVSRPDAAVMRLKYAKLLQNLSNAVQALCGTGASAGDIVREVRSEALACYEAARVESAAIEELGGLTSEVGIRPVPGAENRAGGSTWQSLARGAGSIETDYLNGEIALLGALHGVATPYNRMLQQTAAEAAREGREPGSYAPEDLVARAQRG